MAKEIIVCKGYTEGEKASAIAKLRKGANQPISFRKEIVARDGSKIVKMTDTYGRLMCEYGNLKSVREKKAETQPKPSASNGRKNPIVHKDGMNLLFQNEETLTYYVRIYRASVDLRKHCLTKYVREGKEYTYEEMVALGIVAPSKLRSSSSGSDIPCYNVALGNLTRVGNLAFED